MTRGQESPEVRAGLLAAKWAQQIGLPPGNLWEAAVARNILAKYREWGEWGLVEGYYILTLGLRE